MTKQFWINLPVKDIHKSTEFFTKIGFSCQTEHGNSDYAKLIIGDNNVLLMLFPESSFKNFANNDITDTKHSTEVLFSIGAQNREEVDELAKKVEKAGGTIFAEPGESQGWMYACGFADLDGHRWSVLHMDMSKMPKA